MNFISTNFRIRASSGAIAAMAMLWSWIPVQAGSFPTQNPIQNPNNCSDRSASAALLVGVDDYGAPEISDLRRSGAEVTQVADALVATGNYAAEAVTVQRSGDGVTREPTADNLLDALERLAAGGPYGTLVVYLTGHGYPTAQGMVFLTADARTGPWGMQGGVELGAVSAALARAPACHRVILLDAGPRALRGDEPGVTNVSIAAGLAPEVAILSSARWDQVPLEAPEGTPSFASLVAGGLSGAADTSPEDGAITLAELYEHILRGPALLGGRVPTLSCLDCGAIWPTVAMRR